ncbi:amino acid adenylation domain-containing protein [Williamsia sp.]|uniref:amino acid adenylation domain-containing protein n=1 Tax=Williamsia sp. TaxID=1872085 RepID=UPI002F943B3B
MTSLDDLQALMSARIEAAGLEDTSAQIPQRADRHRAELSFAQRRIWMHQQLYPDSIAYNVCLCLHFTGKVDDDALVRAFEDLARHNESLRTTFHDDGGSLYQRIHEAMPLVVDRHDLTHLGAEAAADAVQTLALTDSRTPFDLSREGPMRVTFVRTTGNAVTVVLTVQHIAWDGMTFAALARSVERTYRQLISEDAAGERRTPRTQVADYADWEQARFRDLDDTEQLRFWKGQLEPSPPPLALPTDKPAPPVLSERGSRVDRRMDPRCAHNLITVSKQLGTTPYTVFLTAYYLLLARFSDSTDVTVGTAVANRDDPGLEELIGNFGNTLALRARLRMDCSFAQTVQQVRTITEEAFAHQDYPFDRIVEQLNPPRALGRPIFFQAMLLFLTQDIEGPALPGCSTGWTRVDNHSAQLPLALEVFLRGERMDVEATYATDLFEARTITRMLDYLEELLVTIGDRPQAPIRELMALTAGDRALIDRWSRGDHATGSTIPANAHVGELLTAQARTAPDRIAVRFGENSLTYREFDARVNQMARHLLGMGTRVGDRVVVMMSRDETLPVTLAAVIRAGAAYVPVDITYPAERVAHLIADSDPVIVLTDSQAREQHSAALQAAHDGGRRVIEVDDPGTRTALRDRDDSVLASSERDRGIHADDPALMIYTSGSTGRPKGVLISQSAIAARLRWQARESGTGGVFMAKSAIGFIDASTELLAALIRGGTVVVADADTAHDPGLLIEQISRHQVTDLVTVPALAHALATAPAAREHLSSIRRWICSGETLTNTTLATLRRTVPGAQILNFYGSTEVTGDATAQSATDLTADTESASGTVPIGSPVADTSVYVLDQFLRPTPPGVTGELYVAGVQVATGYHDRPARTAERFVANPLRTGSDDLRDSGRLYRTGDLARWNHLGQLEYLGRADQQVKLRGFRIELGEVRVALEAHPAVESAVAVTFRRDPDDEMTTYLAAFYTLATGAPAESHVAAEQLREHMARHLPQYMIPSEFVPLESLPVNAHGKIDTKALLPPDLTVERHGEQRPLSDTERHVAAAFRDVLALPAARPVDGDDNFFHLGGHSLSATRLVAHLNAALESGVTMRSVFEAPTVALLSAEIERLSTVRARDVVSGPSPAEIVAEPRPEHLALSAAQERLWFFYQVAGPSPVYNIALAFRIHGPVDSAAMAAALTDLAARHEVLRTRFEDTEHSGVIQIVEPADDIDVHFSQTSESDVSVQDFLTEQSNHRFELDREHPIRAALLRLHTGEHILSITVHHIAFDQWSGPILFSDLEQAYRVRATGMAPNQDPLPIQYADYAAWQRLSTGTTASTTTVAERQLNYWQEKLTGIPEEVPLPTDRTRPAIPDHIGASITRTFPSSALTTLKDTCRRLQVTEYMAANAAVAIALHLNGSGLDIPVGTPISGRGHPDLGDLIGFFVNTLVIRNDLHGDPSLAEMLSRVRHNVLDAFDNQDLPFERLVDALGPERSMARHPLFQTMAVYRTRATPLRFGESDAEFVPTPVTASKFDLEFEFQESMAQELTITLIFATELFDESTAQRLLDTLERVLTTIADDPDRRISQLASLSSGDELRIRQWSSAATRPVPSQTLDQLLAQRCDQMPERVAMNLGTQTWTYQRLSEACNRLARSLITHGIGAGERVAIMAPRSPELIVAITGVLATGAAYVPVDPAYPADRIAYLLTDSAPSLVLVMGEAERGVAQELTTVPVVTFEEAGTRHHGDIPLRGVPLTPDELVRPHGPSDTAYVMYTSGSTGMPKGVVITHANIVALFAATAPMGFTERDVWTLFHSYSFDFSVWEIWGALLHGGRLVVVDQDTARDPSRFGQLLRDEQVSVLSQTPSAFYSLIRSEHDPTDGPPGALRTIVFGGEALDHRKITEWQERQPDTEIGMFNMFGITETTVHTTVHRLSVGEEGAASIIGRPLPNLSTFVLDACLRPTPPGATGELYVAGPQVAEAYFNRPSLSASRFVANPFRDTNPALRLYRTGDLARWSNEGVLEYRGRADQQVKIRGFRIELDEIRSALEAHPAISEATVIARDRDDDGASTQYLVGYWVPSATATMSGADLRTHLQTVLPAHMVPAHLIQIPAIPITTNGKLDRRALPDPTHDVEPGAGRDPASPTENSLAEAYAEVLGLRRITADDDFFNLGGDSISALALVRKARRMGVVITAPDVFTHRTVAALAQVSVPLESENTSHPHITPAVPHRPTSLTPGMHRQLLGGNDQSAFRQTLFLAAPPDLDTDRLERSLRVVIKRHAALSLTVGTSGGQPTISHVPHQHPDPLVRTIRAVSLSDDDLREHVFAVEQERADALDLASGSLTNMTYFDREPRPGVLAWTANHFAVDHASWDVLIADLAAEYNRRDDLQHDTDTSFLTWLELLNAPDTLERFRQDTAHWIEVLTAAAPMNPPAEPTTVRDQHSIHATLPSDLRTSLVSDPPRRGLSTSTVLLAGLASAVQRWRAAQLMTATPGLLIDVEGHGRSGALAGPVPATTVGWFTTLRPVAVPIATDSSTDDGSALKGLDALVAANAAMSAGPADDIGYGVLRDLDEDSQFADLPRSDVQFRFNDETSAPDADHASPWTSPDFLPRFISASPPDTPLSHALSVDIVVRRSQQPAALEITLTGDRSFTADTLQDLAKLFDEELESMANTVRALPEGMSPADSLTPQAVAPMANQHRLRLSGVPLDQFVLTEVVDLDDTHGADTSQLSGIVYSALSQHDSLRQRLIDKNRLLWTMEVLPPSARSVEAMTSVHDLSGQPRDAALETAWRVVCSRIDPREGRNLHVALVESLIGRHLIVGVHAAVADRRSVHLVALGITSVLESGAIAVNRPTSSIVDVASLLENRARSAEGDAALERIAPVLPEGPAAEHKSSPDTVVAHVSLPGSFHHDEIEQAFTRACHAAAALQHPIVDVEVDQREFLADEMAADHTIGWLTTTCPRTADQLIEIADRPWYPLVRYNHRRGRRVLKATADATVLLTQSFGRQVNSAHLEGAENFYSIVGRYRIDDDAVDLEVTTTEAGLGEGLVGAWHEELSQLAPPRGLAAQRQ